MSSQRTPGPWQIVSHPRPLEASHALSVGAGPNGMASIAWMTLGSPASEANAHLIAAAPDLLEALVSARELMARDGFTSEMLTRIDAAIAKATGR